MTFPVGRATRRLAIALVFLAPSLALFAAFVFVPLTRTLYISLFFTTPTGRPIQLFREGRVLSRLLG